MNPIRPSLETLCLIQQSTKAVCEAVGLSLIEPEDWLCCGASAAHRADPEEGLRLTLENLALIEQSGFKEVTMPCASCFNRHKTAQHEFRHDEDKRTAMNEIGYQDNVHVSTLSETIRGIMKCQRLNIRDVEL